MAKLRLPILLVLCLLVLSSAIPIGKDENAKVYLQKFSYLEVSMGQGSGPAPISEESVVGALKGFQRFAGLNETGTNMFQVAVHVFGPTLGLADSDDKDSVMAPSYYSYRPLSNLGKDPVTVIQTLDGAHDSSKLERKEAVSSSETNDAPSATGAHSSSKLEREEAGSSPETNDAPSATGAHDSSTLEREEDGSSPEANRAPDICGDPVIDTITRTENGSTYVFKGDFYWEVLSYSFADGYPRRISDDWDGLVGNLDASFTWANGKTYIFKGEKYWRFTNKRMDPDYPKLIRFGFDGIPDAVDAALVWSGDRKTYFFKGDQYWQYDSHADPSVSEEYPRPISDWVGLPNRIDAALGWKNARTYFFNGNQYYRFNNTNFAVNIEEPSYPRPTSPWWFGC